MDESTIIGVCYVKVIKLGQSLLDHVVTELSEGDMSVGIVCCKNLLEFC